MDWKKDIVERRMLHGIFKYDMYTYMYNVNKKLPSVYSHTHKVKYKVRQ